MSILGTDVDEDDFESERIWYLKDSYAAVFHRIEIYYKVSYGEDKYSKMALDQIEVELKKAQDGEASVDSVTGNHERKYADTIRKKVKVREQVKGKLWEISKNLLVVLAIMLIRTFRLEYALNLYDRFNQMYLGVIEIFLIPTVFLYMFVRKKLAGALFYKPTLMKVMYYAFTFILYVAIYTFVPRIVKMPFEGICRKYFSIPFPIYLLIVASLLLIMFVTYRKSKKARY